MSRPKRRKGLAFGVACLALPVALIWWLNRPRPPYEFVGPAPDVAYLPISEAERKPTFDVTLPLLGRVRMPSERVLGGPATPSAYCGYLLWGDRAVGMATLAGEGWSHILRPDMVIENPDGAFTIRGDSTHEVLPLPYATDEAYRDVELGNDEGKWKLRLPYDETQGASRWKSMEFKVGRYTVKAEPEPWRLTTAPFVMALSADLPPGRELLLTLRWRRAEFGIQELPEREWLLEAGKKTYVSLPRSFDGIVTEGAAYEMKPVEPPPDQLVSVSLDKRRVSSEVGRAYAWESNGNWVSNSQGRVARAEVIRTPTVRGHLIVARWNYRFEINRPRPLKVIWQTGPRTFLAGPLSNAQIAYRPEYDISLR